MKNMKKFCENFFRNESKIASDAFWQTIANLSSRGSLALSLLFVARILGAEKYGIFGIVQNTIVMFQTFAIFGMGITTAKYIPQFRIISKDRVTNIVSFSLFFTFLSGILLSLIVFFFSNLIALTITKLPIMDRAIKIGSILIFLYTFESCQNGILIGFKNYKEIALINIFSGLLLILCLPISAYLKGVEGTLISLIFVSLIKNVYFQVRINKLININLRIFKIKELIKEVPILWNFSLPALLSGLVFSPAMWLVMIMLSRQLAGIKEVGIFSASYQWFGLIIFLPSVVSQIFIPIFSENIAKYDLITMKNNLIKGLKIIIILLIPTSGLVVILSPLIMYFYGHDYYSKWYVLTIIGISGLFAGTQNFLGNLFASLDKMWTHFNLNFLWCILFIGSSFIITKYNLGAIGVSLAHCGSYLIRFCFLIILIYPILKGKINLFSYT